MTDLTMPMAGARSAPASTTKAEAGEYGVRVARYSELPLIHDRLMEAISTSPYYCDDFKAFEMQRLTPAYLAALHQMDPGHIFLPTVNDAPAGFMISGPEMGTLWLYWSYIFPEWRNGGIAMQAMRKFIAHWDNGRFHKVSTFTRPDNKIARLLMQRYGYKHIVTLEKHFFGEDYMLYEHPLTKAVPGYDRGIGIGLRTRLAYRFKSLLGH